MVIGEVDLDALDRAIDSVEEELGRTVNYTLFEVDEWRERMRQGHSFITDVLTHEKILLIGDEDDLSALGTGGAEGNCGLQIAEGRALDRKEELRYNWSTFLMAIAQFTP